MIYDFLCSAPRLPILPNYFPVKGLVAYTAVMLAAVNQQTVAPEHADVHSDDDSDTEWIANV